MVHTILYPVPALCTGGTEQQLLELVRGLDKRRFHPIVATLKAGGALEPEFRAEPGVELVHVGRGGKLDFSPIWQLAVLMRSRNVEIVQPFLTPTTSFAILAGLLAGTSARILTERSGARTELNLHLRLQDALTQFATCVVANSEAGRDCLVRRGISGDKVVVITNGINSQRLTADPSIVRAYRARLGVPDGGHVVGILASLLPVKDHHTFLRAASLVGRSLPATRFAIFGDGPLRSELVALGRSLGLAERVTFFGTQQGVANCLAACDMLVSASLVEGLSNSILEAMWLGVPVIATDIPGNRELVEPRRTGWRVPVGNPEFLALMIEHLLTHPNEVAACVEHAKEMVTTRFGLDRMVSEHVALYESLLTGRLHPAPLAPGAQIGSQLRVGLVIDGLLQPRWVHRLVQQLQASSIAEIELVALAPAAPRPDGQLLYRLYTWLDDRLFQSPGDALHRCSLDQLLGGIRRLRVSPARAELTQVADSGLDVLLDLGGCLTAGESAGLARFGVWTLHHGRDLSTTGAPPGFWEVFEQHSATGSLLAVTDGAPPGPRVIYRSFAPTNQHSVRRSKSNYYPKTADFVMRKLAQLHAEGPAAIGDSLAGDGPPPAERHRRTPKNREMARLLRCLVSRYLCEKASLVSCVDQWFVAYSADVCDRRRDHSARRFTYLLPPADRYWADPFPVRHAGQTYIFLEEFLLERGRAHISVSRVNEDGTCQAPVRVLERPYHLSYPFVFEWQSSYYMLPESGKNRTVELYRASRFPFEWQLARVLLEDLSAADATLAHIDDRWWLFANVAVPGSDNSDELHLFYADSPLGPWRPHRRNPVKSDARSARPAGRILRWRGAYLRPAQDCAGRYGRAVILNRIVTLDPERYVEREVGRIEPDSAAGVFATHTLNLSGSFVCLDGVIRAPKRTIRRGPRFADGLAVLNVAPDMTAAVPPGVSAGFRASGEAAVLLADEAVPRARALPALC